MKWQKVGQSGVFIGEFHHALDAKSRLIVPAKFRTELGKNFVMTRGLEGCLFVFPEENWKVIAEKISALPLMKKDARKFSRMFLSGATEVEVDKSGRFVIPAVLSEYADLQKDCAIIGVQNRLEVWSKDRWTDFCNTSIDEYEEIAEELIDFELNF